jgi:hypothetical protein
VGSIAPDGTPAAAMSLGDAAPEWELGGFATALLPPTANGIGLAVKEHKTPFEVGFSRWRSLVRVVDERARECGVPWVAAEGGPVGVPLVTLAVDDHSRVLVFFELFFPYKQAARWFTIDGEPLTDEFPVAIPIPPCDPDCSYTGGQRYLTPLIGGGVAFQQGLQYLAVFPSAEPRHEPAPAWLRQMDGHMLHRVGGDKGYAFMRLPHPYREPIDCSDEIAFVAAGGRPCGTMNLDSGFECATNATVGRDGTVIQMANRWRDPCRFVVYDGLLQ